VATVWGQKLGRFEMKRGAEQRSQHRQLERLDENVDGPMGETKILELGMGPGGKNDKGDLLLGEAIAHLPDAIVKAG